MRVSRRVGSRLYPDARTGSIQFLDRMAKRSDETPGSVRCHGSGELASFGEKPAPDEQFVGACPVCARVLLLAYGGLLPEHELPRLGPASR